MKGSMIQPSCRDTEMGSTDSSSATDAEIDFQAADAGMELAPAETFALNLLEWAVERHASDLFISDAESCVIVSVRRMGRIEQVRRFARSYGRRLQGFLRVAANCDAGDAIRPTEGRGVVQTPCGREIDLRLSTMPTLFGTDVAVRLFDPESGCRDLNQLGMDDCDVQQLRELLSHRGGLILVSGPVASGKSSTMYAAVKHLNDGHRKIHTLEDPIEHAIDGVMQTQVNAKACLDFADLLTVVLRHSPDVIMIGEIRDSVTATTAVRAGASGQLVLATIHAKSAAEAIDSLLHYDVPPKFVANALVGVICQRLVRRLCKECRSQREVHDPLPISPAVANRLGDQPPGLWTAQSCDACFGDGYESLFCLAEIMRVEDTITHCIEHREPASAIHQTAKEQGMLSLADNAALNIYRGEMTADDAIRIINDGTLAELSRRCRD
ncbi:GspE/PulE family protein [Crateriforma conspicua]|nr:ATPase, T2SS/T4P/T4SS family [Crateriforma conspicua]